VAASALPGLQNP